MSTSPSQQQQPKQYQLLHQAWLDGTDQPQSQPQPQPQLDEFGYNHNNNHHHDSDGRTTSLMEPLLLSSSTSTTALASRSSSSNNMMNDDDDDTHHIHDPLLSQYSNPTTGSRVNDSQHDLSSPPSSPPAAAVGNSSNHKKVVRFNTDVIESSDGYHIQNNHNNNNHHCLRQRNATTTPTTSVHNTTCSTATNTTGSRSRGTSTTTTTSNTTVTAAATSTYYGRLLNRYYNNTNNNANTNERIGSLQSHRSNVTTVTQPQPPPQQSPHHRNGGGIWNVQHIHKQQQQQFHPANFPLSDNDDIERSHHHDIYDTTTHHHDDDIDQTSSTGTRNRHRTTYHPYHNNYCTGCWEFWNTWFYTLAYQRTIVLILILFTTYTGIVVFYAMIYFSMSRIGQSIIHHDNHDHEHPASTLSHTLQITSTTTTVSEDRNLYYMRSNHNHTTSHITETTDHMLSTLLLFLFCDMDLHTPMEALYFSLSTMASIGYGVSDYYFGNCGIVPLLIVLLQICTAICYDAVAIGLLFQRLRRSHKRSKSIWMTNTAVIRRIQMIPYFMIRIAELRRYPLVNATIRAYCIYHDHHLYPTVNTNSSTVNYEDTTLNEKASTTSNTTTTTNQSNTRNNTNPIQTTYYVTKPMMLQQHDILMNIPQVIVHPIRMHESPLCPPSIWYDRDGIQHTYRQLNDPSSMTTTPSSTNDPIPTTVISEDMEQIQLFLQDRNMEIIIVIEGTDELTGTCTQTKQSYTYSDIEWNAQFVSCIYPAAAFTTTGSTTITSNRTGGGGCIVDFAAFHSVEPAPLNSDYCPYIQ